MPPPKKVELLEPELLEWLHAELKNRRFGDYVALADELNAKLEEQGLDLRIGKSALHNYGQEREKLAMLQREASSWAEQMSAEFDLTDEAKQHRVLFQMMTTIAFKVLKSELNKDGKEVDPKDLRMLAQMMKDVMTSSGIREKLMANERARIAKEAREQAEAEMTERFDQVVGEAGLGEDRIAQMRREFLGLRS